jgi:hypothetical protein
MWLLEKKLGKLVRALNESDERKASKEAFLYWEDNRDRFTWEEYKEAINNYHKTNQKFIWRWRGAKPWWLPISLWIKLDSYVKANA